MSAANYSAELCRMCDGRVECAPTAVLLFALVHTLYGHLPPEPDYFGRSHQRRSERPALLRPPRTNRNQTPHESDRGLNSKSAQRDTEPGSSEEKSGEMLSERKEMLYNKENLKDQSRTLLDTRDLSMETLKSRFRSRDHDRDAVAELRKISGLAKDSREFLTALSSKKKRRTSRRLRETTKKVAKMIRNQNKETFTDISLEKSRESPRVANIKRMSRIKITYADTEDQKRKSRSKNNFRQYSREDNKKASHGNPHEFDFIIVGGGTAGCVLASRLSENKRWKVLLLEAGPEEPKLALVPSLTNEFKGSSIDWQFSMRPKKGFCQNRGEQGCEVVQGRVLGGTSSINDLAYMRGNPADYDEWAFLGNEGWSFSHVLAYFKYSEGNYDKDIARNKFFHSTQGGPLDVGRYQYVDENVDVLLGAFNELGYNYTDINGRQQLGFTRIQTMSYFGERVSTYTAFIEPVRKLRENLEITTEALVTKVMLRKRNNIITAEGVEFYKGGIKYQALASKEIIISAGAINTPKILMLSGLGPKEYMKHLNVTVFYDLPVGGNLQDHLSVCLPIISLTKTSTNRNFSEKLKDITNYYGKGVGPLSANFQVVAFLESSVSSVLGTPDIELRFRGYKSITYYDRMDICVSLLTPSSRGQIVLNASDPHDGKPLIYPNFLKDPLDELKLVEGIKEASKLFDTDVFRTAGFDFDPQLILNNECKNNVKIVSDFWKCIIKQFSSPLHNYVGTCKMGPADDPEAVVDSHLKVYGVKKLRVVDASIMPKITRGSTAAPVVMIAEKASDLIKYAWY